MMMAWFGGTRIPTKPPGQCEVLEIGSEQEQIGSIQKVDPLGRPLVSFLEVPAISLPPNFDDPVGGRLRGRLAMTGHGPSVTHVSGINRNPCARNGP
jgi:hypothetical protein